MNKKYSLKFFAFLVIAIVMIAPHFSNQTKAFENDRLSVEQNTTNSSEDKQKKGVEEEKKKDVNKIEEEENKKEADSKKSDSKKDAESKRKVDSSIKILAPQNGAIVEENFQINIKDKEDLVSASVYLTDTASKKSNARKITDLERVGDYWTGVVDINTLQNDIYYFQVRGSGKNNRDHVSRTFWINIDKTTDEESDTEKEDIKDEKKGDKKEEKEDKREEKKVQNIKDIEDELARKAEEKKKEEKSID